jgi:hypothetical protein
LDNRHPLGEAFEDPVFEEAEEERDRAARFRNCLISTLCCHCLGCNCCKKGTRSRTCAKRFFKAISVGQINNGLYFGRSQQYLSSVSGIFTLIGVIVLLTLSIKVFIDIFDYANVQAKLVFE